MEYYGYIYESVNNINGHRYIGKRKSKKFIKNYFGSGVLVRKAIAKYGKENFSVTVLKWCVDNDDLNESEKMYIQKYNAVDSSIYYNIAAGGEGANTYAGKSEEEMRAIKRKISIANSGERNGNKGQYTKEKNSMFGKKHPKETRMLISEKGKMLKINRSHPWTKEKQEKRTETLNRYKRIWKVENLVSGEIYENFTNNMKWISTVFPKEYKCIDYFDRLELTKCGDFVYGDLHIVVEKLDLSTMSCDEIEKLQNIHTEYRKRVYNMRLEQKRDKRKCKKN